MVKKLTLLVLFYLLPNFGVNQRLPPTLISSKLVPNSKLILTSTCVPTSKPEPISNLKPMSKC